MKRMRIEIAILATLAVAVALILPHFAHSHSYSGPGAAGTLRLIQQAKDEWLEGRHTNEWPTAADLWGEESQGIPFPKYGEVFIINRTGEPPCVYISDTATGGTLGDSLGSYCASGQTFWFHFKVDDKSA